MKNLKKVLLICVFLFNLNFFKSSFFYKIFCCKKKNDKSKHLKISLNNLKNALKEKLKDDEFVNFKNNLLFKNQGLFYVDLKNFKIYKNLENDIKYNFLKILKNELNLIINFKNTEYRNPDIIIFNINPLNKILKLNDQMYKKMDENSEIMKNYKNNKSLIFSKIINESQILFFFIIFHNK